MESRCEEEEKSGVSRRQEENLGIPMCKVSCILLPGAHYPERATSIQCLWNDVFTRRFIFRISPSRGLVWDSSDQIRSFHFFWILLKVSLTIAKAREKPTRRGFNRKNSHSEKCSKGKPLLDLHMWKVQIKRMELWEDQFKEWWIGMVVNDNWKTEYSSKNNGVSPCTIVITQTSVGT